MENNLNSGHRSRLRQRFLRVGKSGLSEHELLELLLFYAIPRKDVKPVAKELLNRFKSLHGVFSASPEQLMLCNGLGECSIALLQLMPVLASEIISGNLERVCLKRTSDVQTLLKTQYSCCRGEKVILLLLDSKYCLVDKLEISGFAHAVLMNMNEIAFKILCCPQVRQVIIAHNHPGNNLIPSRHDIHNTLELKYLLSKSGITLLDHFIVADGGCRSIMKAPEILND